jgi:hypothetical protein
MIHSARRFGLGISVLLVAVSTHRASAQVVPVSADAWTASDSLRTLSYHGRPAVYINRGVALVRGASMENGTIDLDVAASDTTNFLGIVFRAASPRFSNVVFLRFGASGTEEAVQYGPAFNSLGVAWQVYHGDGANAVAEIPRNQWFHLRLEVAGPVARLYVDTASVPTLLVPRIVASGGSCIGIWTGAFGRGAYFANVHYTASTGSPPERTALSSPPSGSLLQWELSNIIETTDFKPMTLPAPGRLTWQPVAAEPEGFVLINRYREAPVGGVPRDSTGAVLVDSVMTGRIAGCRVVYARTNIEAGEAGPRRLQYTYSNGVVIYLNGQPLAMAMNPAGLRSNLGVMAHMGDAVYLPLKRGANQLIFAVIQCTGGWAYSARLDPPGR